MGLRIALSLVAFATAAPDSKEAAPRQPRPPVFLLRDRARVSGLLGISELPVETRYGKLLVPVSELVSIRLARRLSLEERSQIEQAIEQLGAEDFDVRERATEELKKLGVKARRHLLEARKSRSDEVKARAEAALREPQTAPEVDPDSEEALEPLPETEDDEVVTRRFTIRGHVPEARLSVRTAYGPLDLELRDVQGILFQPEQDETRTLSVSSSNSAPEAWLNTRITLSKGQRLTVSATGQLHVPNYNLTSGPEGTSRYSGSTLQGLPMLALVGKVGKNGKPFLVGRDLNSKAPRDGVLYLGVVPFRRNYAATGSYQVKVGTKR